MLTEGRKVFLGTAGGLAFCYFTFFGINKPKAGGHNLFDQSKPEALQQGIDKSYHPPHQENSKN